MVRVDVNQESVMNSIAVVRGVLRQDNYDTSMDLALGKQRHLLPCGHDGVTIGVPDDG